MKSTRWWESARTGSRTPTATAGCRCWPSTPDARLLWYFDHAHGSGPAYRVVTVTAVEDGAAWLRLAERMASGDLRSWARDLDGLQHESHGRILTPLEWSPTIALAG